MAEITRLSDDCTRSISSIARLLGLDRSTVTRHLTTKEVKPAGTHRGHPVYSVADAARAIFGPSNTGADGDPDRMSPKERLDWYRGSRERRQDQLEAGQVVDADEARHAMATLIKALMLFVDTQPEALERKAHLTPSQVEAMESAIDGQRRTLHGKLQRQAEAAEGN